MKVISVPLPDEIHALLIVRACGELRQPRLEARRILETALIVRPEGLESSGDPDPDLPAYVVDDAGGSAVTEPLEAA